MRITVYLILSFSDHGFLETIFVDYDKAYTYACELQKHTGNQYYIDNYSIDLDDGEYFDTMTIFDYENPVEFINALEPNISCRQIKEFLYSEFSFLDLSSSDFNNLAKAISEYYNSISKFHPNNTVNYYKDFMMDDYCFLVSLLRIPKSEILDKIKEADPSELNIFKKASYDNLINIIDDLKSKSTSEPTSDYLEISKQISVVEFKSALNEFIEENNIKSIRLLKNVSYDKLEELIKKLRL